MSHWNMQITWMQSEWTNHSIDRLIKDLQKYLKHTWPFINSYYPSEYVIIIAINLTRIQATTQKKNHLKWLHIFINFIENWHFIMLRQIKNFINVSQKNINCKRIHLCRNVNWNCGYNHIYAINLWTDTHDVLWIECVSISAHSHLSSLFPDFFFLSVDCVNEPPPLHSTQLNRVTYLFCVPQ